MKENMKYFDTHAHYRRGFPSKRHRDFHKNMYELLERAYRQGVRKIVNVGLDVFLSEYMVLDFKNYPWHMDGDKIPELYFAVGEHPKSVKGEIFAHMDRDEIEKIRELCKNDRVVAIKTGLDYSMMKPDRERQHKRFREWIRLSQEVNLPLVIHVRDAYEDAIRILKEEQGESGYRGVIHCFTQGPEMANVFIEMGFVLGIGGKVTYPENVELRETVTKLPLKHFVLETDCPFVRVMNSEGPSSSKDVCMVAEEVWRLKKANGEYVSFKEVGDVLYENSELLFGTKEGDQ